MLTLHQNGCTDQAGFCVYMFPSTIYATMRYLKKYIGTSIWYFVPSHCGLRKFGHSMSIIGEHDINKRDIGLSLTAPGDDGGRGQVRLTVNDDRQLLITLSIQLCIQHNGQWHNATSSGSIGVSQLIDVYSSSYFLNANCTKPYAESENHLSAV